MHASQIPSPHKARSKRNSKPRRFATQNRRGPEPPSAQQEGWDNSYRSNYWEIETTHDSCNGCRAPHCENSESKGWPRPCVCGNTDLCKPGIPCRIIYFLTVLQTSVGAAVMILLLLWLVDANNHAKPVYLQANLKLLYVMVASVWYAIVPLPLLQSEDFRKRSRPLRVFVLGIHIYVICMGCALAYTERYRFEINAEGQPTPIDAEQWNGSVGETPWPLSLSNKMVQGVVFTLIGVFILRKAALYLRRSFQVLFALVVPLCGVVNLGYAFGEFLHIRKLSHPIDAKAGKDGDWVAAHVLAISSVVVAGALLLLWFIGIGSMLRRTVDLDRNLDTQSQESTINLVDLSNQNENGSIAIPEPAKLTV